MRPDERALLSPWLDAFEQCFGAPAEIHPWAPPGPRDVDLYQLSYAPLPSTPVIGQMGHFQQAKALEEHVTRLGYAWDDSGTIRKVPTPSTFNHLLAARGGDIGYFLEFQVEDSMTAGLGAWLLGYMRGVIPIHVCTPSFYHAAPARTLDWHLTALVHDLSVHALNYHLVPRQLAIVLGERIRTELPERAASWSEPNATAPLTLSFFFDNDLNRFVYEVWNACTRPNHFSRIFTEAFGQLESALMVRIRETREGKGDVPSGSTDDMAELEKTVFSVHR